MEMVALAAEIAVKTAKFADQRSRRFAKVAVRRKDVGEGLTPQSGLLETRDSNRSRRKVSIEVGLKDGVVARMFDHRRSQRFTELIA